MTATIRVDLLGGVDVSGADPAQVRSSARAVSLLAYLVSHPESRQPRVHLAGVLRPDSESAQARTNLRRELHHLRGLLDDNECLRVDAQSLCWRPGPEQGTAAKTVHLASSPDARICYLVFWVHLWLCSGSGAAGWPV